jgi:hypothetical protein
MLLIIYNYGLHEKLISIIIKLRKGYFPEVHRTSGKITLSRFNNYVKITMIIILYYRSQARNN